MNPLLQEIYSTIAPSMPYLIAAYVLIMVILFVWVFIQFRKQSKLAARLTVLEEEQAKLRAAETKANQ